MVATVSTSSPDDAVASAEPLQAAPGCGRIAGDLAEGLGEMRLVREAELQGDIGNRQVRLRQQFLRKLYPPPSLPLLRRPAGRLLEDMGEPAF